MSGPVYVALGAFPPDKPRVPGRASRRTFIKRLIAGLSLVALGGIAYRVLFARGRPAPGNRSLTEEEMKTAEAVAETFFPGPPRVPVSARDADVPAFVDGYVADLPEDRARLFKLLLRTLEWSTLPTHGSRFTGLPVQERRAVLDGWNASRLYPRRTAYRSLRLACAMGYFENDRVREAVGWRLGCLPSR